MDLVNDILFKYTYLELYALTFVYFLALYFIGAPLFAKVCSFAADRGYLNQIESKSIKEGQVSFEIKHSLKSIVVFGFSVLPIIYLIRAGKVDLLPNTVTNVLGGVVLLTLWNEVHFFVVHRFMHVKFMMKHVHKIHHQSKVPTVHSVYSFHWIEALLLSTIPLTIVPFVPFSPLAISLYPLASILLNFAGHCNYRFGDGIGNSWRLFGTHHNEHHCKGRKNYGFALNYLDKLWSKLKG